MKAKEDIFLICRFTTIFILILSSPDMHYDNDDDDRSSFLKSRLNNFKSFSSYFNWSRYRVADIIVSDRGSLPNDELS